MARRRTFLRNAGEFAAAVLFDWLFQCLGPAAASALSRSVGRVLLARPRSLARAQLARAFPDWSEARITRTARACFDQAARIPAEVLCLRRQLRDPVRFDRLVERECDGGTLEILRSGPAIFVTAHLGNWELGAAALARLSVRTVVITRDQANPYLTEWLARVRTSAWQTVVSKQGALLALVRAIRRGESATFLLDQDAHREGVFVPFFGRPASTHDGASALALRMKCPIITCFFVRERAGRFRFILDPPVSTEGLPADPRAARRELTGRITARIEAAVRRFPEQWIWHYYRWKTEEKGVKS